MNNLNCLTHNKPFRQGQYGMYCATKMPDGTWCKQKPNMNQGNAQQPVGKMNSPKREPEYVPEELPDAIPHEMKNGHTNGNSRDTMILWQVAFKGAIEHLKDPSVGGMSIADLTQEYYDILKKGPGKEEIDPMDVPL